MHIEGNLRKLESHFTEPVEYGMPLGNRVIPLNPLIDKFISLQYKGIINCIHCGRKTSKSFSQGYCFPCMRSLAECDSCIVRPETCHFAEGTCRDEEWALANCMQEHYVYLANSSDAKVGITRGTQVPTRWIDQGASQALPIFRVKTRLLSGKLEHILRDSVSDRTDWRRMLRGEPEAMDLAGLRDALFDQFSAAIDELIKEEEDGAVVALASEDTVNISYPVLEYPEKITALNFDKTHEIHGRLLGIKGQYLILDKGVINIRKFGGYYVKLSY
jgi:hypothetical protein